VPIFKQPMTFTFDKFTNYTTATPRRSLASDAGFTGTARSPVHCVQVARNIGLLRRHRSALFLEYRAPMTTCYELHGFALPASMCQPLTQTYISYVCNPPDRSRSRVYSYSSSQFTPLVLNGHTSTTVSKVHKILSDYTLKAITVGMC